MKAKKAGFATLKADQQLLELIDPSKVRLAVRRLILGSIWNQMAVKQIRWQASVLKTLATLK